MNTNTPHAIRQEADGYDVLRRYKKSCLGREREYALLSNGMDGDCFRISVKENSEVAVGEVSGSFADAAALFDRIVRGEVAPYVLGEILDDFMREKE